MKQPTLFDVPKDSPSRRERIEAFKKQHQIVTFGSRRNGWSGMLVGHALKALHGYGVTDQTTWFDIFSGYCRLLDERDLLVSAPTELAAIRDLCALNEIACPL